MSELLLEQPSNMTEGNSIRVLMVIPNIADSAISQLEKFEQSAQTLQVHYAHSGQEALDLLKEQMFDAIVSELDTGAIDAWRLVRMLRSGMLPIASDTPFLLLCDSHDEQLIANTAHAFAINHVVHPNALNQLPQRIVGCLAQEAEHCGRKRLLVVEDESDIAELISRILGQQYKVQHVSDGERAITAFNTQEFDIVLLDMMLPRVSGRDVLKHIMANKPQQLVITMTANGDLELAQSLLLEGATDFISKPFKASDLRESVQLATQRQSYQISHEHYKTKLETIRQREEQYRRLSETHQRLVDNLGSVVMELDDAGVITFANSAWNRLTGFSNEHSLSRRFVDFVSQSDPSAPVLVAQVLHDVIEQGCRDQSIEFRMSTQAGKETWVLAHVNPVYQAGDITGATLTLDNISARKGQESKLNRLVSHDRLTNLYNRHHFNNELARLADIAKRYSTCHSLICLDLDHFKLVNDTHGHLEGDGILREVSARLSQLKRPTDILCRIAGDEFAILLPRTPQYEAQKVAQKIIDSFANSPIELLGYQCKITFSMGIAAINGFADHPVAYQQNADIALYTAKNSGRNRVHVFAEQDKTNGLFKDAVRWVHHLRHAIEHDQIEMHFQPVIDAQTQEVQYFEALVRMRVDGRLVMPGEFIPALERAEDIALLDSQVIVQVAKMMNANPVLSRVAINLSAQAFNNDRLVPLVEKTLKQYDIAPERVIFEVTETDSLHNIAATQNMINQLTQLGCEFAVDDFGTGFSTFNYLKHLPANCVKIDGSFVKDMLNNPIDFALVKSINEVAKALGKKSVAEFVEDEATSQALRQLGVDLLQGYYVSRPEPVEIINRRFLNRDHQ